LAMRHGMEQAMLRGSRIFCCLVQDLQHDETGQVSPLQHMPKVRAQV
jgi:hypothetical protein